MCRHAGFRWGERCSGNSLVAQECVAVVRSGKAALWVVRFVLCFLLICIVVVPVPFVCCSVKLPLSRPTSFCLFLSILLRTPAGGGAAAWRFCYRPQPNHNNYFFLNFSKFNWSIHKLKRFFFFCLRFSWQVKSLLLNLFSQSQCISLHTILVLSDMFTI